MKKKVSFDFDNTLSRKSVQKYAKELISKGYEVWIVTSRYDDSNLHKYANESYNNNDLYAIAQLLAIPKNQIQFMNMEDKYKFFLDKDFVWHLDDDIIEINMINAHTPVKGISYYNNPRWKLSCERHLDAEFIIEQLSNDLRALKGELGQRAHWANDLRELQLEHESLKISYRAVCKELDVLKGMDS